MGGKYPWRRQHTFETKLILVHKRTLRLFFEEHKPLRKETDRDGSKNVHHRMLLHKGHRNANHSTPHCNKDPPAFGRIFLPAPCRCNSKRESHMQGWTYPGIGVQGINDANQFCHDILSWKHQWPELLPAGTGNIDHNSSDLGDDEIDLQFFEAVYIIQQKIHKRSDDQKIPAHIRNHKPLAKWNHIIQPTVNQMTSFHRDQVLGQYIEHQITNPSQQKEQVGKFRGIQIVPSQLSVIDRWGFHKSPP